MSGLRAWADRAARPRPRPLPRATAAGAAGEHPRPAGAAGAAAGKPLRLAGAAAGAAAGVVECGPASGPRDVRIYLPNKRIDAPTEPRNRRAAYGSRASRPSISREAAASGSSGPTTFSTRS